MKAKLLLQDLCRKKLSWDSLIDEPEKMQWSHWLEELAQFQDIDVSECSKPKSWWLNRVNFVPIDPEIEILTCNGLLDWNN